MKSEAIIENDIDDLICVHVFQGKNATEEQRCLSHTTWMSKVIDFGPLQSRSPLIRVTVSEEHTVAVFQRDYNKTFEAGTGQQFWNQVENTNGHYAAMTNIVEGEVTNGQTNNLQFLFFMERSFFVIAVTMQVSPKGNLIVVCEKTWHGNLYKDEAGVVRTLELERKTGSGFEHPLLSVVRDHYKDAELPLFKDYPLWLETIRYRGLHVDEMVVFSMDTGLHGGTYHCRDKNRVYHEVHVSHIIDGCQFLTVGSILKKRGSRWAAIDPDESEFICLGRLDFRLDKQARTRIKDVRSQQPVNLPPVAHLPLRMPFSDLVDENQRLLLRRVRSRACA